MQTLFENEARILRCSAVNRFTKRRPNQLCKEAGVSSLVAHVALDGELRGLARGDVDVERRPPLGEDAPGGLNRISHAANQGFDEKIERRTTQ